MNSVIEAKFLANVAPFSVATQKIKRRMRPVQTSRSTQLSGPLVRKRQEVLVVRPSTKIQGCVLSRYNRGDMQTFSPVEHLDLDRGALRFFDFLSKRHLELIYLNIDSSFSISSRLHEPFRQKRSKYFSSISSVPIIISEKGADHYLYRKFKISLLSISIIPQRVLIRGKTFIIYYLSDRIASHPSFELRPNFKQTSSPRLVNK